MNPGISHLRSRAVVLLAALLFFHAGAHAQTTPKRTDPGPAPESILWVGNSFFYYNNSMHNHFGQLVASAGGGSRVREGDRQATGHRALPER